MSLNPYVYSVSKINNGGEVYGKSANQNIEEKETAFEQPNAFLDLSPLCRVGLIYGNFILHSCQTELGTSGGPLLTIDKRGNIELAGIQIGRSESILRNCSTDLGNYFPNYALVLPSRVLKVINGEAPP